jgi:hypothetical protein
MLLGSWESRARVGFRQDILGDAKPFLNFRPPHQSYSATLVNTSPNPNFRPLRQSHLELNLRLVHRLPPLDSINQHTV